MFSRSIRRRAAGSRRQNSLGKRSRSGARSASFPLSSTLSRSTYRGATQGTRRIAGSTRYLYARPGRDLPLYVPRGRLQSEEMHYLDKLERIYQPYLNAGTIELVNEIDQGTSLTHRLAARATCLSLQLRGLVSSQNTGICYVAMLLIIDRQPQGALPTILDIFDEDTSFAFQRTSTRDRFSILYRKDFSVEGTSSLMTDSSGHPVNMLIKMRLPTTYTTDTTSGSIANVKANALYIVTLSNALVTGTKPAVALNMRLAFQA